MLSKEAVPTVLYEPLVWRETLERRVSPVLSNAVSERVLSVM